MVMATGDKTGVDLRREADRKNELGVKVLPSYTAKLEDIVSILIQTVGSRP